MKSANGKKSQAFKKRWPPRLCALFKCKREFPPNTENQKFHIGECRIRAFWIKKEGGADAEKQGAWEIELRERELLSLRAS